MFGNKNSWYCIEHIPLSSDMFMFDDNGNINGKWAEACALIILVCFKTSYVCVITEENDLALQTLSSLKK